MKLLFAKSKWEMGDAPLSAFLQRAAEDGFDAVEVNLPAQPESATEISHAVSDHGLRLIAQIQTQGATPVEHLNSLESRFAFAADTRPVCINSHTGRDIFSFADNVRIFERACALSRESGIPFMVETHRSRPTGNAVEACRYLEAVPELKLNLDVSHWMCVHETDLSDQEARLEAAIDRTFFLHARVGFDQGPQVPDPLCEVWKPWTDRHLEIWRRVLEVRRAAGHDVLPITPEFGPPPYMPVSPHTGQPVAEAWETNVRFLSFLREALI